MTAFPVGPVLVAAALVGGILVGEAAGPSPAGRTLAAALAAATAAALLVRRPRVAILALALATALAGTALAQRALHGLAVSPLSAPTDERADVTVRGTLVGDPQGTRFSARVLLRVDDAGRRRVLVRAGGEAGPRLGLLDAGDRVVLRGWLEPLSGYDARYRWQHAVATFHAYDLLDADGPHSPLDRAANAVRRALLRGAAPLRPVDRALFAGFLLGDTRGVPSDVVAAFRASGLTHLMAVSGSNVAFVLAVCAPVLRRLGLTGRLLGAGAILALFGTMTRWEPSVLRAVAMTAVALVAGYLGRPASGLRVFGLAFVTLLLIDPFLVHSVGFVLSCAASVGILVLGAPITRRLPGPAWVREVVGVTAAAQLGVAPLLIPVFGSLPLVSVPANLVAVPLAGPLTVWGLVTGLLGGVAAPFAPQAASALTVPTGALLHALHAVADVASRVDVAVDGRGVLGTVAVVSALAAVRRARRFRRDARPVAAR